MAIIELVFTWNVDGNPARLSFGTKYTPAMCSLLFVAPSSSHTAKVQLLLGVRSSNGNPVVLYVRVWPVTSSIVFETILAWFAIVPEFKVMKASAPLEKSQEELSVLRVG